MSTPARFAITLSWGLHLTLTLYPLSRSETSAATMTVTGCSVPVYSFFPIAECRVVPPASGSRMLPWSLWLGSVSLEISESEAAALQEFITAARAGQQAGA
jgi:hypothetical protein